MNYVIETDSPAETRAHAAAFAAETLPGTVIRLSGDLGAGKTEWVKGFAAGLGFTGPVTSPTFSLLHEYHGGRLPLFPWDLYRLSPDTNWLDLDLPDHLPGSGVTLIEWPDRYRGPWPRGSWHLHFNHSANDHRRITLIRDV